MNGISPDEVSDIVFRACDCAVQGLADQRSTDTELVDLVAQLAPKGHLTASLLLRALCLGHMAFFEHALARLADMPLQNARILVHDHGGLGLESVYMKADLPKRLFPAFRAIIDISDEVDDDGGQTDRPRFVARLLQRVLTQFEDPQARLDPEDIDYLLGKLEQVAS